MSKSNQLEATKKVIKDFFSAIIGKEIEFTDLNNFFSYETMFLREIAKEDDIIVKSCRLLNYRQAFWVYIPGYSSYPKWIQIEVHDEAKITDKETGEVIVTWQVEKLRYSEIIAIEKQLELHRKEKIQLSSSENIYVLGPAKKLDDLTAKIAYGLSTAPSD